MMSGFFDGVNEYFFNPLVRKNRQLHLNCINELIQKSNGSQLYEEDAVDILTMYFNNQRQLVRDDEESEVSKDKPPGQNARLLLNYFRRCGWIVDKELGRNGDNLATVTPLCQRVIDALDQISEQDNAGSMTNQLLALRSILKDYLDTKETRNERRNYPYQSFLSPMMGHVRTLKLNLQVMHDNIHEVMKTVFQTVKLDDLWHIWLKDKFLEAFFTDYYHLKQNGNDFYYLQQIKHDLAAVRKKHPRDAIVDDYMRSTCTNDRETAEAVVDSMWDDLEAFIDMEYEAETRRIDQELGEYYDRYISRMEMIRRSGVDMGQILNDLLLRLSEMDPKEGEVLLAKLKETTSVPGFRYLGEQTFRPPKEHVEGPPELIAEEEEISEEELQKQMEDFFAGSQNLYSQTQVQAYIEQLLEDSDSVTVSQDTVHSRKDAVMFILAVTTAGAETPYDVLLSDDSIETEVGQMSSITIIRRKGNV